MTSLVTQTRIDAMLAATKQRWLLAIAAVSSLLAASILVSVVVGGGATWLVLVAAALAVFAAVEPDDHIALAAVSAVAVQWVEADVAVTTGWLPIVALLLFLFHVLVAVMAATPITGVVPGELFIRWLGRSVPIAGATVGAWLLAAVFDQGSTDSNSLLAVAALAALAVSTVGLRRRGTSP